MNKLYALLAISFLFFSCEKEETPVSTPVTQDTTTNQNSAVISVNLTDKYTYQVFFSLSDYKEVSQIEKTSWDLGLQEKNGDTYISLNSSRAMYAASTNKDFDSHFSVDDYDFLWDNPDGNLTDLVIGTNTDNVYLIDLGYSPELEHLGYKKIKFNKKDNELQLITADLDGKNSFTQTLNVNTKLLITPIALSKKVSSDLMPNSNLWDIQFTQYTHQFDAETPYLVTGLLLNPNNISVSIDSTTNFSDIDLKTALTYEFSTSHDAIGYNWKSYNIEAASYTVFYHKNYIIKTKENTFYKLRFLDFYDNQGKKGNIKFEIVQL